MSEVIETSGTVLVTGATSGIGYHIAKYLKEQGYQLLLVGRDTKKTDEISKQLNEQKYYICDLSNINEIKGIFDYCKDNSIVLNGMIHSAGCVSYVPVRSLNLSRVDVQMQVHYYAFLELCKNFYSKKISLDGSSIVAISSLASITMNNGTIQYSASKAALNTAVSITAKEFAKRRIRVNAILPANVNTRMSNGLDDWVDVESVQPFGLIQPEDIAYLSEFLLSVKSKYITGALIPVSGGMEV